MKKLSALLLSSGLTAISFSSFLVKPYFQPGTHPYESGREQRALIFEMEPKDKDIKILLKDSKNHKILVSAPPISSRFNTLFYKAIFKDLESGKSYKYQVLQKGKVIFEDEFKISIVDSPLQLTVFGCAGEDTEGQKQIANLLKNRPLDGIIYLGDFTYKTQHNKETLHPGTAKAFRQNFFKPYETIFSKVPFYSVIGNKEMDSSHFDVDKESYAYFDYVCHPLNGPETMPTSSLKGKQGDVDSFLKYISHYKRGTNYSVEFYKGGKPLVHLQVVDGNAWMDPSQEVLQSWMRKDLQQTKAPWKIACIHQPLASCSQNLKPFEHLINQFAFVLGDKKDRILEEIKGGMIAEKNRVRQYAKVWQESGVQLVLSAHLHGYERSKPLELLPKQSSEKEIEKFEEKTGKGPVYIITGAAGAHLHLEEIIKHYIPTQGRKFVTPQFLESQFALFLDYTDKIDLVNYSFSTLKIDDKNLVLEQINKENKIIDTFKINL